MNYEDHEGVNNLLDFIAQPESGGDYNIVWGGIKAKDKPTRPLTQMTIGAVLNWQDKIDPFYQSEASGKWQIMEDTLRGLYPSAGLNLNDLYNPKNQKKLAIALLVRRGLDDYFAGTISAEKFADNLSKEWASLPAMIKDRKGRPATGQSYYAGDGLNKSHVSQEAFLKVVKDLKKAPEVKTERPLNFFEQLLKCLRGT